MPHDFYCDEVLTGKIQIDKILETERVLAFRHTRPMWPVHIIVIPKTHIDSLMALEDTALLLEMMSVLKQVIQKVNQEYGGCRLTTNFGSCQTTKHLHWHVYVAEKMLS